MCTDFLVFNKHDFAHRKYKSDNYVCYRTVISHALLWKINHTRDGNYKKKEASDAFHIFANAVEEKKESESDTFLSLYIANMRGEIGYIVVDKSRGYYPLVVYPFINKKGAPRAVALRHAVKDLSINLIKIIDKLQNARDWSSDLQEDLQNNFFNYTEENIE